MYRLWLGLIFIYFNFLLIVFLEGHVDPGENDLQAAFRETEEEAGLKEQDLAVIQGFESVLKVRSA